MLEHLKSLGLTETEARCYLCLYENGEQSGYEVAKNLGISRSNVYASLASLHQKGMCRVSDEKTSIYSAVDINEVIDQMKVEFKTSARYLEANLHRKGNDVYQFFSINGYDQIMSAAKRMIAAAKKSVLIDVWNEDLAPLLNYLEEAEYHGVDVKLVTFKPIETTLKTVILDRKVTPQQERDFSILVDEKKVLIGTFNYEYNSSALETEHPTLVRRVLAEHHHDVIISKLSEDFKNQIQALYDGDIYNIIMDSKN